MDLPDKEGSSRTSPANRSILVWDLPTRLFHWLLVALIITSFTTGYIGGVWMRYHMWSGYAILGLLAFRLAWGFAGGRHARFTAFVRSPVAVVNYARTLMNQDAPKYPGHNPMGGWSVLAMLLAALVQVVTGLFANDDIFTEGPLFPWVSKSTSDWLTHIHRLNQQVLLLLIGIHVAAVLFYLIIKRENLILPMFTGQKYGHDQSQSSSNRIWLAMVLAIIAGVGVYFLVR